MPLETLQFEVLIALPFNKFIRSRAHWSALGKRLGTNLLNMLFGDDWEKDHTFQKKREGLVSDQMDRVCIDELDLFNAPNITVLR